MQPTRGKRPEDYRADADAKRSELLGRMGLSEQDVKPYMEDARKLDFSKNKADSAVLHNGTVVVNPDHLFDESAYTKAVQESEGSDAEKAKALTPEAIKVRQDAFMQQVMPAIVSTKEFQEFRGVKTHDAASLIPAVGYARMMGASSAQEWDSTPPDMDTMREFMQTRSWGSKVSQQVRSAVIQFGLSVPQIGTAIASTAGSQTGREMGAELMAMSQAVGASDHATGAAQVAGGVPGMVTQGALSMLPAMAGGFGLTSAAGALSRLSIAGRGLITAEQAAALSGRLGVLGSAGAGALQSYGGVYYDAVQAGMDKGLTSDQAHEQAVLPAFLSGLSTLVLSQMAGPVGDAAFFRSAQGEAMKRSLVNYGKLFAVEGAKEATLEEMPDQLIQGIIAKSTYDPDKSLEEIVYEAGTAWALGFGLGGIVGGKTRYDRETVAEQGAELMQAAEVSASDNELTSYASPDVDPAESAAFVQTAQTVRAIAQGADVTQMTEAELASIGIKRGPDGQLKNTGSGVPAVKLENGAPIITQGILDQMAEALPNTRALVGMSETEARQANAARSSTPSLDQDLASPTPTEQEQDASDFPSVPPSEIEGEAPRGRTAQGAAQPAESGDGIVLGEVSAPPADASPAPRSAWAERAITSLPPQQQAVAAETADLIAPHVERYAKAFGGGVVTRQTDSGAGLGATESSALVIDLPRIAASMKAIPKSQRAAWVKSAVIHEAIHSVAVEQVQRPEMTYFWDKLSEHESGQALQSQVIRAYHAAKEAAGESLPSTAEVDPWQMGHELLRMVVQKDSGLDITEAVAANRTIGRALYDFLRRIHAWLGERIGKLPPDQRATLEDMRQRVMDRMDELGLSNHGESSTREQSGYHQAVDQEVGTLLDELGAAEVPNSSSGTPGELLGFEHVRPSELSRRDQERLATVQAFIDSKFSGRNISLTPVRRRGRQNTGSESQGATRDLRRGDPGLEDHVQSFIDGFERLTGRKVIFVDAQSGSLPFQGLSIRKDPEVIFVNARSHRQLLALIGHEWGHTVESQNPPLYKSFLVSIAPLIEQSASLRGMADDLRNPSDPSKAPYREAIVQVEISNNIIGDAFTQREFWQELHQKDRRAMLKVAHSIHSWFDALETKATKTEFGTESFIKDLKLMRKAVADLVLRSKDANDSLLAAEVPVARPSVEAAAKLAALSETPERRTELAGKLQAKVADVWKQVERAIAEHDYIPGGLEALKQQHLEERMRREADANLEEWELWNEMQAHIAMRKHEGATREELDKIFYAYKAKVTPIRRRYLVDKARMTERHKNAQKELAAKANATIKQDKLMAWIRTLDAIRSIAPYEVRGKIGGYAKLAELQTDGARYEHIKDRVKKLETELEKYQRRELTRQYLKLLAKSKPKGGAGEKMKGKLGADIHALFRRMIAAFDWDADTLQNELTTLNHELSKGDVTVEREAHIQMEMGVLPLVHGWHSADAARMATAVTEVKRIMTAGYADYRMEVTRKRERRKADRHALVSDVGKAGTGQERDERAMKALGLPAKAGAVALNLLNFRQVMHWMFGDHSKVAERLSDMERNAANSASDAIHARYNSLDVLFTKLAGSDLDGQRLRWNLAQKNLKIKERTLSPLEAITATLMWAQPKGREHMEGRVDENGKQTSAWRYDQAFINEIESKLSTEAKKVREFLREQYANEYDDINPTYRQLHGVDMPKEKNYAQITVRPTLASSREVDPQTGAAPIGASTPRSLLGRGSHITEPDFQDALQVWLAHVREIQHWKAYAPFMAEARPILGHLEVRNSLESVGGRDAVSVLQKWLQTLDTGGANDAAASLALSQWMRESTGRAASMVLVGNIGTLLIQNTQLAAGLAAMPTTAYLSRMGKLLTGQLGWGKALESTYIQRRLKEMPPAVRQAMEGLKASKPSTIKHYMMKVGSLLTSQDALMTAGTYAIVYDYRFAKAKKAGRSDDNAHKIARALTERIVDDLAQPTRIGARSIYENLSVHPAMRLVWAFASDARKNLGVMAYAMGNKPWPEKARAIASVWILGSMMAAITRAAWRDARDDDDDEWFDPKHWSAKRLLVMTATGPLAGLPVVGGMLEDASMRAAKIHAPDGDVFSRAADTISVLRRLDDLFRGEVDASQAIRDMQTLLYTAGIFNDTAAAGAAALNVVRDVEGVGRNVVKQASQAL